MEGVSRTERQLARSEWDGEVAWKEWVGQTWKEWVGRRGSLEGVSGMEKWLGRSVWDGEVAWEGRRGGLEGGTEKHLGRGEWDRLGRSE